MPRLGDVETILQSHQITSTFQICEIVSLRQMSTIVKQSLQRGEFPEYLKAGLTLLEDVAEPMRKGQNSSLEYQD